MLRKLKVLVVDWQGVIAALKTAGALLIGNSVLVLFEVIGNGSLGWRLMTFVAVLIIGVLFLIVGNLIQRK
jgi:hypothetical protein